MAARTWIAVALSCLVWFAYLKWFAPTQPSATEAPVTETKIEGGSSAPTPKGLLSVVPKEVAADQLHNDKIEVSLSDVGGKVSEVHLLGYRKTIKQDSDYITPVSPEISALSLASVFSNPDLAPLAGAKYEKSRVGDALHYEAKVEGAQLAKDVKLGQGYLLETSYHLTFDNPKEGSDYGYFIVPIGATELHHDRNSPLTSWEVVAFQNDSTSRKNPESWKKETEVEDVRQGNTGWMAFGNRYFSTALINKSELNPDVVFRKTPGFVGGYLRYPIKLKPGQKDVRFAVNFYVGPKESSELAKVPGLRSLIDYGTFSFLAFPLLELLRFFFRFIHNYGVAIILLTLVVRLLFYPLQAKAQKSMKAMQKLQPQIAALKERYKDDPTRMNEEQMALFKAHKVNPAGGCLPMLVQLPVFIALYSVLQNSIELFHAPFFGWIQDLSSKDPLYIYPVLMGLAMLGQQKLMPTAGMDPAQAKMMLIMPVVFTFIMMNLPAGLTMYIFISTLLGILQQVSMRDPIKAKASLAAVPGKG